jgi:hypothetical protein
MTNPVENSLRRPQLGIPRLSFSFKWPATQRDDQLSSLNPASFMHKHLFHHAARRRPDRHRSGCTLKTARRRKS